MAWRNADALKINKRYVTDMSRIIHGHVTHMSHVTHSHVTRMNLAAYMGRWRGVKWTLEVGGWGRDPKKCTGRDWGMGSSTI